MDRDRHTGKSAKTLRSMKMPVAQTVNPEDGKIVLL